MSNHDIEQHLRKVEFSLIGNSPEIKAVLDLVEKVARAECTVLILGLNGTGKELVAKAIHNQSRRAGGPFIAVNCAALQETLIESELFGFAKGAFSGAFSSRMGKFEAAKGGTIFLDEIGDMPLAAQAKILRALQERVINRLGENQDRAIDCRVIAATNKDLNMARSQGTFREDLYHRLSAVIIEVPPLSERNEDIPLLVDHFLEKLTVVMYGPNRPTPRISEEALDILMQYSFPGSVRELENLIASSIVLSDGKLIRVENLPQEVRRVVIKEDSTSCDSPRGTSPLMLKVLMSEPRPEEEEPVPDSWPKTIRAVRVEEIARFLTETGAREFSRKEFELFLRRRGKRGMDKSVDGTAGRYLRALIRKGILEHNGGKANKSRFRVSENYLNC